MANDYCTVDDIKETLADTAWDASYDRLISRLITASSRALDRITGRDTGAFFAAIDSTRYFDGSGGREQWIDELAAVPTSVSVAEAGDLNDYTLWVATDYLCWPYNGPPFQRLDIDQLNGTKSLWFRYPKSVRVAGKFGYSTEPPDDVRMATIIQAVRWFKRGQQAFRDVGAIPDLGQLMYTKALDPDVGELVKHLRRVTI